MAAGRARARGRKEREIVNREERIGPRGNLEVAIAESMPAATSPRRERPGRSAVPRQGALPVASRTLGKGRRLAILQERIKDLTTVQHKPWRRSVRAALPGRREARRTIIKCTVNSQIGGTLVWEKDCGQKHRG